MLHDQRVSLTFVGSKQYPRKVPFSPSEKFPEYSGNSFDPENEVYSAVRKLLFDLGMDRENFGTPVWNPFKDFIQPGMTVFIKPNTVTHRHGKGSDIFSAIVHASVVRPVIDYVLIALKEEGKIIIGDSPLIMSEFDKAMATSQITPLLEWYGNNTRVSFECIDLRTVRAVRSYLYGRWARKPVNQDRLGYTPVNLGTQSCFEGIDPARLRIAIASHENMKKYHSAGNHRYLFPNSFLASDVVISLPKLKTHRRTAVTLALKNFMGIPSLKDSLPHFITGSPQEGGDQYINPSFRKRIITQLHDQIQSSPYMPVKFVCAVAKKALWNTHKVFPFKDNVYEAMWHGNDTLWRTLMDLNRAALYAGKDGVMRETQQRSYFCIIDGITGGEKEGPLEPDPVSSGVLLAGFNPVAMDAVGATLMGFNYKKIPLIRKCFEASAGDYPLSAAGPEGIVISDGQRAISLAELPSLYNLKFEPHPGWKGNVEL
ncbi:conserved hypothetical protein [Syntrophobacter sp. SbD1]|nr:conserved hypothetical protein [Syntrophobacter sp. SbD1]